jgi:hypothetical protein
MPLVQDDHLVQAIASDTPNQTLDIRMLQGRCGVVSTSLLPMCRLRCRKAGP